MTPSGGGRPALLIGGSNPKAFRRAARNADGRTQGGGSPERFTEALGPLRAEWPAAGREGEPRTMALFYFGLGESAEDDARRSLGDYYAYLGEHADGVVAGAATEEQAVAQRVSAFEEAGADEVLCFPTSTDPARVDLLADTVLR